MTAFYEHRFSTENKHEILGESDINLGQELYGKPTEGKSVEVRAIFNSKKAKVLLRNFFFNSKPEKVKIVFTLKPTFFTEVSGTSGDTGNAENSKTTVSEDTFKILLAKLTHIKNGTIYSGNFRHFIGIL